MMLKTISLNQFFRGMPERYDGFLRQLGYEPDSYPGERQISLGDIAIASSDGAGALYHADLFPQIKPYDLVRALMPPMRRAAAYSPNVAIYMDKLDALERSLTGEREYNANLYKVAETESDGSLFNAMHNLDLVASSSERPRRHLGVISFRAASGATWTVATAESTKADGTIDEVLEAQWFALERRRQACDVVALFGTTHAWSQLSAI